MGIARRMVLCLLLRGWLVVCRRGVVVCVVAPRGWPSREMTIDPRPILGRGSMWCKNYDAGKYRSGSDDTSVMVPSRVMRRSAT